MDQIELTVNKREIMGKKVRFLRRQGITPIHLFGSDVKSAALQCETVELRSVLAEAGRTRLINLRLDNERKARPVVVREVQREPRTSELLHVDFYQVKMAELVRVEVPIVLVGEAPALKLKENMLAHELNTMTVECLPANMPASIELDISSLTEVEQAIRVRDVELDKEVTVLNDPEVMLVKISSRPVVVEEVERVVAEEEAVAAEAPEAPEGGPSAEGEAKEESSSGQS